MGFTSTICNVSHRLSRGQKNKQQKQYTTTQKNNGAAGYLGPANTELLKSAGLHVPHP